MSWKGPVVLLTVAMLALAVFGSMRPRASGAPQQLGDEWETVGAGASAWLRPKHPRVDPNFRPPAPPDVQVGNWHWEYAHGLAYAAGAGTNTSGRELRYVSVELEIHDKQGQRLGSTYAVFSNLHPGERFVIREWVTQDAASTFNVGKIVAY